MNRPRSFRLLGPLLLGATLALGSAVARAGEGVNAERARQWPVPEGLSGSLELKLALRQGNVDLVDIGAKGVLSYRRRRHHVFVLAETRFAAQATTRSDVDIADLGGTETRFINRHRGHIRYAYRVLDWLLTEGFTQIETDEFILLRTRFLLGIGPRFALFENDDFAAHLGTSYMAEHEALDPRFFVWQPTSRARVNWWHRWNNYLSLRLRVQDGVWMRTATYVQPRFAAPSDLRLLHEANVEVAMGDRLSLKLTMAIRHDTKPPTFCRVALQPDTACSAPQLARLEPTDLFLENSLRVRF